MNSIVRLAINNSLPRAKIISAGRYLPKQIVKSDDLFSEFDSETKYGIATNWMSKEMGIIERRMSEADASPSSLAIPAAREAIDSIPDFNPDHIDMVIFCGIERDQPEPATAHLIQKKLGLKASFAFDVSNACFGFIDGLRIAQKFITSNTVRYALIVTGEIPTKLTTSFLAQLKKGMPLKEAKKIVGFLSVGDAGGAIVVGQAAPTEPAGFDTFRTESSSIHYEKCYYKHLPNGEFEGQMLMARIVAHTLKLQKSIFDETMATAGWDKPDFLLTHQVGKKSFDEVANIGITPKDRMIKSFDQLGNITSATFPVNHYDLIHDPRLKPGDKIFGCYSGSGIVVGQFGYTI